MTSLRAAPTETNLPAPPRPPAPEDFPPVAALEPPRLPPAHGIGLALGITIAAAIAVGIEWLSADGVETAPILFLCVIAAAWWLDRRAGLAVALVGGVLWAAVAFAASQTVSTGLSALVLGSSLVGVAIAVSAARERERAIRFEELRREQARMILAVQLRESVVSIDVAVPLLADPMTLDRAQGAAYDQVRRHARGLTRLASDLLTLDQMDTRRMSLTTVPVDLAAFVLEITEQRVPHDRATIVTPSTPVQVNADPERLRQLFDHLLQNAIKFSAPTAGVMVKVSAGVDEARVAVRDHGVGLSADDMKILFTRYGRIRDARTANVSGMGLGLYLAKLIAEAHGGDLEVESRGRGLGATFTAVLPLAGRARRTRPQRELPASSFWD
ncbi:MAG: hypothetical protein QOH08_2480 [Chloroflexota bacterium]|nr:hypothetical protein [Chloroflexota bacterium]